MLTFQQRLRDPRPILMDGATGTEIARRGGESSLPLWGAAACEEAPELLAAIHRDYVLAGCELVCSNTFRTTPRTLAKLGREAGSLTSRSVEIARASGAPFVAGSMAPLEDCWRPELRPPHEALEREHLAHATELARAGCDLLLVETHNSSIEASIAAEMAVSTGLPVFAGFSLRDDGRLRSGEEALRSFEKLIEKKASGLILNCTGPTVVDTILDDLLLLAAGLPLAVYPNLGSGSGTDSAREIALFVECCRGWVEKGARLIGGCCGSSPAVIASLAQALGVTGERS